MAESDTALIYVHLPHPKRFDKDCQEEQSSIDFVPVVAQLCSLGGLPEALSEEHKICGFVAALEDDDLHAASSYKLPIGGASADILADTVIWDAFL